MYTIADINTYFEAAAHQLRYIGHTIGGKGLANRYARFNDEETLAAVITGMGFPRMILSALPTGTLGGNTNLVLDKLSLSVEVIQTVRKDDFSSEMTAWNNTRACLMQLVARMKKNKLEGTCNELEKYFDFNSVRYELIKGVDNTGPTAGTRMSFTLNSYLTNYDSAAWQP